jgi:hypothetical protein
MPKRGKILRDTSIGPGLVMVDGQQYTFTLDHIWRSEVPPRAGMAVDVDFLPDGSIAGMTAVAENQLAREQAEQAMAAAKAKGSQLMSSAVARFGLPTLIATGLLLIGWFFLTTISIKAGFAGTMDLTFWRILALVNSSGSGLESLATLGGGGSAGFYGLLAILALAGPFIGLVWKDKRATLGGLLPLLFMLLVTLLVRHTITSAMGGGADMPSEMADMARKEMMKAISFGIGGYVSIAAALYLAFLSAKNFLLAKANN